MSERLLVLVGPTASGKTRAAVDLAHALGGPARVELVGADSVQIYKRLAIGSARPTPEELRGITHHLLDVVPLDAPFDAARFAAMADDAIRDIRARGRLPIVVGGAGLYVRALVRGLADGIPSDPLVRAELHTRVARGELATMHAELSGTDPVYARSIHPNDPVRVVRALEAFAISGVTLSEHHRRHQLLPPRYDAWMVGIETAREVLRARIALRAAQMLEQGWVDEVRGILADGYAHDLKALRSVGYAEVVTHLRDGDPTRDALAAAVTQSTSAFAKRQRTWFRGEQGVDWRPLDALSSTEFISQAREFFTTAGRSP